MPTPNHVRALTLSNVNSVVAARHGLFLINRADFFIGTALLKYGEYAEQEWRTLAQCLSPGMTVVEVGAHIGSHTMALAQAVGPSGRVIAIEPQRVVHHYLGANVVLNSLTNVETVHAACGAEAGTLRVPWVDYYATGRRNLGGIALSPEGEGEPVALVTVDGVMGERPLHLLKIDVEGMEVEVLQGAHTAIRRHRPLLYVENDRPEKSDALIAQIWKMNYRTFWDRPPLFNPENYFGDPENIYPDIESCNMLCLPTESCPPVQGFVEATALGHHPYAPRGAKPRPPGTATWRLEGPSGGMIVPPPKRSA